MFKKKKEANNVLAALANTEAYERYTEKLNIVKSTFHENAEKIINNIDQSIRKNGLFYVSVDYEGIYISTGYDTKKLPDIYKTNKNDYGVWGPTRYKFITQVELDYIINYFQEKGYDTQYYTSNQFIDRINGKTSDITFVISFHF